VLCILQGPGQDTRCDTTSRKMPWIRQWCRIELFPLSCTFHTAHHNFQAWCIYW